MSAPTFGERFLQWAAREPSITFVALIGSRARDAGHTHAADEHSDWDFQVGTTDPERFREPSWLAALGLKPLAYVYRVGRLSSARKVTALFAEGEVDWVILADAGFRELAAHARPGASEPSAEVRVALSELSAVLQGGYRLLKGAAEFGAAYDYVATRVPAARLADEAALTIAEGFVCDYVSTLRKIERGELIAARRWVHHQLFEANFRLLHEVRLRAGHMSLPDARRLEWMAEPRLRALSCETLLTAASLREATEKSAETFRGLMRDLVGERWRWPDLSPLRLRGE